MDKLRIAAVSYLNARPLIDGLEVCPGVEITCAAPSKLMQMLQDGRADVALVPAIDFLRAGGSLSMDSDYCISCLQEAMTVKIFSPVPIDQITTVNIDCESHCSVALAKIIINNHTGTIPAVQPTKITTPASRFDTPTLLIGDKVLRAGPAQYCYDLGQLWYRQTKLPFVFAVWAAVSEWAADEFAGIAGPQIERNLTRLDQLAQTYGPRHGFTVDQAKTYFKDIISYRLDDAAGLGFQRFIAEAAELDLCRFVHIYPANPAETDIRQDSTEALERNNVQNQR